MKKLLTLTTIWVFCLSVTAQYHQDFSLNKKRMEDSCWIFVNANTNASIGNNMNLVTGNLTTDGYLESPYFEVFGSLSFSYRSQASGVTLKLQTIDFGGSVSTVKSYSCASTYTVDTVSLTGVYKLRWLFESTSSTNGDRGYIDYISINGSYGTDSLSCLPFSWLKLETDSFPFIKKGTISKNYYIEGNILRVNAEDYTIQVYGIDGRKLKEVKNQPLELTYEGLNFIVIQGVSNLSTFKEKFKWIQNQQ